MRVRVNWWLFHVLFLFAAIFAVTARAQERAKPLNPRIDSLFPETPVNYLTDMAAMVADPDPVNARFAYIRDSLKLSLVAVTLETTREFDVADVAREIGRKWMVATANDTITSTVRNTGAVILLVADSRQCRIETATGTEGYLTDATAASLCRNARDEFRGGRFGPGLIQIADAIAERHVDAMAPTPVVQPTPTNWGVVWAVVIVILTGFAGFLLYTVRQDRKRQERERKRDEAMRRAYEEQIAERKRQTEQIRERERQRKEAEQARWDALTPEKRNQEIQERQQAEELVRKRREADEAARRKRQQEEAEREASRRQQREEEDRRRRNDDDDYHRRSSSYTSFDYDSSSSSSSSSSSDSGYSSGGSDSFSGGGGGSDW